MLIAENQIQLVELSRANRSLVCCPLLQLYMQYSIIPLTEPISYYISFANTMSTNKTDSQLKKYLIVGGVLAKIKTCNLETTKKIIKEVKYQMYTYCIPFAELVESKIKSEAHPNDIEIYFRTELAKGFEIKENPILSKYEITREQYKVALEKFKDDLKIKADQQEIFKLLDQMVKGKVELQIAEDLKRKFKSKEVTDLYRQLCELISIQASKLLQEVIKENPNFNAMDNIQYKKAIKKLDIYDLKVKYLQEKGFKDKWDAQTLLFFKLLERLKRQNLQKIIGLVQRDPQKEAEVGKTLPKNEQPFVIEEKIEAQPVSDYELIE